MAVMTYFRKVQEAVARLVKDEEAASAIEYAIVAGVVVAVLLAGVQAFFGSVSDAFEAIAGAVTGIVGEGEGGGG
jgi:Flp pilus assembly pilin Flp